jgi:hypothetical protein
MTTQGKLTQDYMSNPLAEFSQQSDLFNQCAQPREVYSVGSSYEESMSLEAIAMYNATQNLDDS